MTANNPQTAREISDASIRAYAAVLIQDYAAGLDYLDLAEHMFADTSIGGVLLTDLDGPEIDDVQRRILDAAHSAEIASSWPDGNLAVEQAAVQQVQAWTADAHDEDLIELEARTLRAVLAELERLTNRIAHLDTARDSAVRAWKQEHDAADELQRERDQARAEVERLRRDRDQDTRAVLDIVNGIERNLGGNAADQLRNHFGNRDRRLAPKTAALAARDEREA